MAENESVTTGWERTNNPLGREPWQFSAKLGINQELSRCLWDYDEAVEALFETVAIGNKSPDLIARPLLYLMRHALELGYKFTLDEILKLDGERFTEPGHNLGHLHRTLGDKWKAARERHDISDSGFDDHYAKTEKAMLEFERLDRTGESFRYATRRNGDPCFTDLETVDLLEIKDCFDEGMVLLRHTADVLEDWQRKVQDYLEAMAWAR